MDGAADPLILTVRFDPELQGWFEGLRRRHFPRAINRIPAHLTLFHHLPGETLDAIVRELDELCSDQSRMPVEVTHPRSLGRGVALAVSAPGLAGLRGRVAAPLADRLTAQDRQGFRPHVTVQNKVTPEAARALLAELESEWEPRRGWAEGLDLWHYRGGPWEAAHGASFRAGADQAHA